MKRWLGLSLVCAGLAFAPPDLDVGVPPGSPLDFIRTPVATPRPERRDVETPGSPRDPRNPGPGETRTEDESERFPRSFPRLSSPLTRDFGSHLGWKPNAGTRNGTETGGGAGGLAGYPPPYPANLYMHCAAYYLMLMLHPAQISEREVICYLIEIGEPAAYAASAAKGEPAAARCAREVIASVRDIPLCPPNKRGLDAVDAILSDELVLKFPYEDDFGLEWGDFPDSATLPSVYRFAEDKHHPFRRRNAVFALRVYDDPIVVPLLRRLVKDRDKVVRNRALAALIRWRDKDIVPWLIKQLRCSDPAFRTYVLHALGHIGDRRAVDPILRAAKANRGDWEFLWGAIAALGRLGDRSVRVTGFLKSLGKLVAATPDPLVAMRGQKPDPDGTRAQILVERVRIALARLGSRKEMQWLEDAEVAPANGTLRAEALGLPLPGADQGDARRNSGSDLDLRRRLEEALRERNKKNKPAPKPPPEPEAGEEADENAAPPSVEHQETPEERARRVLREWRSRLLQYSGVRTASVKGDRIRVEAASEGDAVDLRRLLGRRLKGVPLEVVVGE